MWHVHKFSRHVQAWSKRRVQGMFQICSDLFENSPDLSKHVPIWVRGIARLEVELCQTWPWHGHFWNFRALTSLEEDLCKAGHQNPSMFFLWCYKPESPLKWPRGPWDKDDSLLKVSVWKYGLAENGPSIVQPKLQYGPIILKLQWYVPKRKLT